MNQLNDSSLFTEKERSTHRAKESVLIDSAKQGNTKPLFSFWIEKQNLFKIRAFERLGA